MSRYSNHNTDTFKLIQKYLSGKMNAAEKNAFEKQALADPFLQEALEGFEKFPAGIETVNRKLSQTKKSGNSYKLIGGVTLMTVVLVILTVWYFKPEPDLSVKNEEPKTSNEVQEQVDQEQEFDLIPMALETLQVVNEVDLIKQSEIVQNQTEQSEIKKTQSASNSNDKIELLDIKVIDDSEEKVTDVIEIKNKAYPFVYFYDLAVVDYRGDENRLQTIEKTTYVTTGLSANYENNEAKASTDLVEKISKVAYMDYLEESMWYFSKAKYKNALNRFNVILEQYPNDLNALFYGGLTNFNFGRYELALDSFNAIINQGDNPFYQDAIWYRVKSNLKLNHPAQAKSDLEYLSLNSEYYQTKALELLQKID